ncbi:type II secretion system protein [Sulfurimonas marina]|uniref:Type II secretion system protein n=1 Tax=Sulfurimonas marina TaxID=2590551 RepID=A0A7M3V9P3_9BACT|nr:prepilin-type N-terminal cleavage/methylation domain-containing protein [Sulfurimonas marina]QOP40476.1 type II secretion system protein [Sulfurimonas marina]
MKRAGFTMIELIFVIVILGILSAVALPKFIGVSEQAKAGKCKAFVGTMNRTVLPGIWAGAIADEATDDNISDYFTEGNLTAQMSDYPTTDCNASAADVEGLLQDGTTRTITFGDTSYSIERNVSASTSESPILVWKKN